jgi:hypothetical protein
MADKIDQLKINGTAYDIDLPSDAALNIGSLTASSFVAADSLVVSGASSGSLIVTNGS